MHHQPLLLRKLINKYDFPEADKPRVASKALTIFTTALSLWKYHANQDYMDKDFETVIKPMWPLPSEEEWNSFLEARSGDEFK